MQYRDPVCGMMVDSAEAIDSADGTQHFCSTACRSAYESNPSQYVTASRSTSSEALEQHEPPNTTAGGITAPKFGSAGSGGAEYERLPEQHDSSEKR